MNHAKTILEEKDFKIKYMKKIPKYENSFSGRAYNRAKKNVESGGEYSMTQGVVHRCTKICPWHMGSNAGCDGGVNNQYSRNVSNRYFLYLLTAR